MMSTIDTDGFLSDEAEQGKQLVLNGYGDAFAGASELNQKAMALLRDLHVDWNDEAKVIIAALFVRIVETYQAAILLLERGMVAQARMLVRTLLDALFSMAAICRQPELVNSYVAQHYASVLKALQAAQRWKQKTLQGRLDPTKIAEIIALNEAKLKATPAKALKVWQWAEKAGLSDYYNVFYVENSSAVHSDMWALNDHVENTPDQEVQVYFGPTDAGLYHALRSCTTALLTAMESFMQAYNIPAGGELTKKREAWEQLDANYYRDTNNSEET
jgi:hypothetical protein